MTMLREWATVIAWQNGIATLRCERRAGCDGCRASTACGTRLFNKLGPQTVHEVMLPIAQPLVPGQRVELGIPDSSIFLSAFLVYLVPLFGILIFSSGLYFFFNNDLAAVLGAFLGGGLGFLIARFAARKFEAKALIQPIILRIALPSNERH